ncbi:MAG: type VI secretion system lipoprotein TssJ [Pseudomonadota bacterium]
MVSKLWKCAAVLVLALGACAEPPPPTTVQLSVAGAEDMNGGLPAKVKVYYLLSTAKFNGTDFFAVFDQPEATLGADLAAVDEYLLAPGKSVADAKSFDLTPVAIGVVAAFREIGQPGWRATAPLAPNSANPVAVTLSGNEVGIGQ